MIPLESKRAHPECHKLEPKEKDVEFSCGENDSGELSRAIMALLWYRNTVLELGDTQLYCLQVVQINWFK